MEKMEVGIIGKGAMGLALEKVLLINNEVAIYNSEEAPKLDPNKAPNIMILAIPSNAETEGGNANKFYIERFKDKQIILTSKGPETTRLYESLSDEEKKRVSVFSGPNLSDQMGETPSAAVLANTQLEFAEKVAEILSNKMLTVQPSESPLVVQVGGVLKNLLVFSLGQHWHEFIKSEKKINALVEAIMAGFSIIKENKVIKGDIMEFLRVSGIGDLLLCTDIFPIKEGGLDSRNFTAGRVMGDENFETDQDLSMVEGLKIFKELDKRTLVQFRTTKSVKFWKDLKNQELPENLIIDTDSSVYKELKLAWGNFLEEAQQKNWLSNTFAWKFCEILENSAKKYSVDLSKEEEIRKILSQFLYIVVSAKEL
jgi:glycerol-3-phosphate dehydrogenase